MSVDDIIQKEITPRLDEECKRLGIPRDFVKGVFGCYANLYRRSYVELIEKDGEIDKVRVRIGDSNKTPREVKKDFWYLMWHVKEIYYGEENSDWAADSYSGKRNLEEALGRIKQYVNGFKKIIYDKLLRE